MLCTSPVWVTTLPLPPVETAAGVALLLPLPLSATRPATAPAAPPPSRDAATATASHRGATPPERAGGAGGGVAGVSNRGSGRARGTVGGPDVVVDEGGWKSGMSKSTVMREAWLIAAAVKPGEGGADGPPWPRVGGPGARGGRPTGMSSEVGRSDISPVGLTSLVSPSQL